MRRLAPLTALLLVVLAGPALASPGRADQTFSGDGLVAVFPGGTTAEGVAVDRSDRIVVAGHTYGADVDIAVARLRWNGALDDSFGGDGRVRIDLGARERALDVAVAEDGKVVVVGYRKTRVAETWFVMRLLANGTRDDSFGGDGVVVTDFGRPFEQANAVAIQSDGRIVVGGSAAKGIYENWVLARYLGGGALDGSFAGDGRVALSLSRTGEEVQDLVVHGTGIFAGGYAERSYLPRFAVAKLRPDGHRATAFGTNGVRFVNVGPGADSAFGLTVQGDGKPVMAGYASNGGRADWGVARLRAGGGLDGTFSGDGVVTTAFTRAYELAASVAMQPNGQIVVAGRARGPSGTDDLAIVRYRGGGTLSLAFSGDGKALFNPFGGNDVANDVLVHAGRVLVVGEATRRLTPRMVVLRLYS
ncbi:MAG TPA: hypothetical protein VFZ75_02000 [Actinomycetota bacterium]|nr:hypothetical protein [Actinomycetota bacterium]